MRAILLAAGKGTRLRPLTLDTPKSLVKVNEKPLLERQIEYLKEIGISDIVVVIGYLAEKFKYLEEKYDVKLVYNDKYDVYNNIYTMYLVKDYLANSYVMEGDVYIDNNFLLKDMKTSVYFSPYKKGFKNEWKLMFDRNNKVYDIDICDGEGQILTGISYWSKRDADIIVDRLEKAINGDNFTDLYWDNIVKDNIKDLNIHMHQVDANSVFEIDCLEDFNKVEVYLKNK